jgi:hypothetical protein
MRHNRFFRSLHRVQRHFRSSSLRRSFAVAMVIVALVSLSLKLLRASNRTPRTSAPSSGAHKPQALASPSMPQLHGDWDLVWKDERGVLLRTHCQIRQNAAALTLYLRDAKPLNADARTPIQGIVGTETISFRVQPRDGDSIIFNGEMDDGILHGTTTRGFSWMAIRHPE